MRRVIVLVGALLLAGCGSGEHGPAVMTEGAPPLEQTQDGDFTLYVSNQSFERDSVDIRVLIDGEPAVEDDFPVENQHNWVEYRFHLDDGRHSLRAESTSGEAVLEQDFTVEGKRWAVVDYWCCNAPDEPKFAFLVRAEPIAFA